MKKTSREEYLARMRHCRPFKDFGITPEWFPGTGDVEGFIHDEVVRQYHDTRIREDGGVRIDWMTAAWAYATRVASLQSRPFFPTMTDVQALGILVEPQMNRMSFRSENVYIGDGIGAPPRMVGKMMAALLSFAGQVQPVQGRVAAHPDAYRALWRYEGVLADRVILADFTDMVSDVETADDWYLAYEAVHPWGDGNGRTGKILHNWLLGTLDDPVLVADYFGGGNP